jgi:hypothetical protein
MNPQRHVIKRQTVEIALGRDIDPWPLQEQVSRWVRGLALAEIDRCCSELSSPDHIHRIERLEVDLGEIQPGDFASGVTPRFAAALRENLAAEIVRLESNTSSQGSSSLTASHLELFSLFVRRGLLPWWANRQLPDLPQSSLDYLLRESPGLLRRLLAELAGENLALKRLTQHFDDQRLAALAALPLPAYPELPALLFPALLDAASRMGRSSVVPKSRLRAQLWQCLLQSAALPDAPDLNPTAFYRSATLRWAERLGLPHAALLGHLSQTLSVEESNHSSAELPANAVELTKNGVGAAKLALPVKASLDTPNLDSTAPRLSSPEGRMTAHGPELPANAVELTTNGVGAAKLALPVKASLDTPNLDSTAPRLSSLEGRMAAHGPELPTNAVELTTNGVGAAKLALPVKASLDTPSLDSAAPRLSSLEGRMAAHGPELPANAAELTINGVGAAKLALPVKASLDTPNPDSTAPRLSSLVDLTATLPEGLQNSLAVHLKAVLPSDGAQTGLLEALEQWLGQHEKALPAPSRLRWYALLGKLSASNLHASVEPSPRALGPDRNTLDFNDVDRVYVSNAGLVILWPFLSRFFDRLGLLREGAFVDADCVQRGVALLQYLASEDPNPSEHLLPLNKLLSGMGLDALFCLEPPLTAREMDECDILLNAVIEHARVLNRMSVAGFRGSFLLRQGVLSTRDGAWLLQAERETFDLVLERFPWGINWVKLSWMPLPLRVEW